MVQNNLRKKGGGRFYFIFKDFTKACDKVDHSELIECLLRKGVNGNVLRLLISTYSSLCSCVRLANQTRTEYFSCNIGTRQGCKLSPISFSLLMNELLEELKQYTNLS